MDATLEREVYQLRAELCAGLADPKRILILYALAAEPRNVSELAAGLQLPQPSVSRHLKRLREHGLVVATRVGPAVVDRLADQRLIEALDMLRLILRDNLSHRAELVDVFNCN